MRKHQVSRRKQMRENLKLKNKWVFGSQTFRTLYWRRTQYEPPNTRLRWLLCGVCVSV